MICKHDSRTLYLWIFSTLTFLNIATGGRYSHKTCQDITIPMCKGIGYNTTYMPNQFNHDTQEEAGLEVHQFWPLVEIECSPDLQFFLCSLYTPICVSNYDGPLPACRSVCERAKAGCAPLMRQYGFSWPARMGCELFPDYGDSENLCMDFNTSAVSTSTISPKPSIAGNHGKKNDKSVTQEAITLSPLGMLLQRNIFITRMSYFFSLYADSKNYHKL